VSDLPQVPGDRIVRALKKAGFIELRQIGSHMQMRHETDHTLRVSVPVHRGKPVRPGTLRQILRGAGLTTDDLRRLL
jgi:predicted RNA binding protein YcfA (HicA-like mRNA interferase family)